MNQDVSDGLENALEKSAGPVQNERGAVQIQDFNPRLSFVARELIKTQSTDESRRI